VTKKTEQKKETRAHAPTQATKKMGQSVGKGRYKFRRLTVGVNGKAMRQKMQNPYLGGGLSPWKTGKDE